jgi:hypothetical protein
MAEQSGRRTRDAFTIRKILACFGPSTLATGAIESAVDLAARLDAELETLFVEDTAVLQLTELPFVRELTLPGLQALPLSRRNLELQCRVLAREAEGRLAGSVGRSGSHVGESWRRRRPGPHARICWRSVSGPGRLRAKAAWIHPCSP